MKLLNRQQIKDWRGTLKLMTATAAELLHATINLWPRNWVEGEMQTGNTKLMQLAQCDKLKAASMKTHATGKIKALKIPKWRLNKRSVVKPEKKIKPPLDVQEHSSGNGVMVVSWPLAPVKTVKESSLEVSTRFNTHSDEGELHLKRLKLFLGEKRSCLPGCEFR